MTALSAKLESVDFEGEKGEQVRALGKISRSRPQTVPSGSRP